MPSSHPDRRRSARWLERSLAGVVAVVVLVELWLLFGTPPVERETVRIALALLVAVAAVVGLLVGVTRTAAYVAGTVLALPVAVVYIYTGLLLPWTRLSFAVGKAMVAFLPSIPVVGSRLTVALLGGFTLTQRTLRVAFIYHYAAVGLAVVGLVVGVGVALWNDTPTGE
ncbi:cytochrome b N-terminal domain-containing protein [Halobacteriaceae archaeon GCM10025711]